MNNPIDNLCVEELELIAIVAAVLLLSAVVITVTLFPGGTA